MRRSLSISLVLLLCLPALAALMPGSEDARLPFCCRRQGAHHCAMEAEPAAAQSDSSAPAFKAPSRCPQFPALPPATISPVFLTVAAPAVRPSLTGGAFTRIARREAAHSGRLRAQLDRGPPASLLA